MILTLYIILSLVVVAAPVCLILLIGRNRRKAREKAEKIREANRTLDVWVCPYCGFMVPMRNQECGRCGVPRPAGYICRTITVKEFEAQPKNSP
jgi:hypothetical protein